MQAQAPRFMFSLPVVHMVEVKAGPLRACPFDEDIKASKPGQYREEGVCHGDLQ